MDLQIYFWPKKCKKIAWFRGFTIVILTKEIYISPKNAEKNRILILFSEHKNDDF